MEFLNRIRDFFIWLFDYVLDAIFNGIISMLELIPVPTFIEDMGSSADSITGISAYYLGVFNVGSGIGIILSAYLIRFSIRRLPFIG